METSNLNALVKKYGEALTEDGYVGIECQGIFVNIQVDANTNALCLYAALGQLPDPVSAELVEGLLEANLLGSATDGGHIGLYSPLRTLVYSRRLSGAQQESADLDEALKAFVKQVVRWISKLDCAPLAKPEAANLEGLMTSGRVLWG